MRTTRRSWLLLLASAVALTAVVAVLAPSDDLQRRTVVAPARLDDVAPRASHSHNQWPFREHFPLPDPVRMLLY